MPQTADNSISNKDLFSEYNWFQETFSSVVQNASDNFFDGFFDIKFIGVSRNVNFLQGNEACFVTKASVYKDYDVFFRISESAVKIILNRVLGKSNTKFSISSISELEAKIITTFNTEVFRDLKTKLSPHDPKELKRSNFDIINITYLLKDIESATNETGKIFISVPEALVSPEKISVKGDKFTKEDFNITPILGKILVGTMKSSLYDIKNLDIGDVVVLENSNIEKLKLTVKDNELEINIKPNTDIIIAQENDINTEGENNMAETHNLWDTIEVDMSAEFDSVKITLGELKSIEQGLVIDLASLYKNNVTLKVEGKAVASGSLVIVNDRYGVKINNVIAGTNAGSVSTSSEDMEENSQNEDNTEENYENNEIQENEYEENEEYGEENEQTEEEGGGEEDFDYSDFELEDENL